MEQHVQSQQATTGNLYPAINLSGNARAIIGNVYGSGGASLLGALELDPEASSSGTYCMRLGRFAVTVLGHYITVKTSIGAYSSFTDKVVRCARQLEVRQTIFHHALRNLLTPYAGPDVAQEMLLSTDHPTWSDTGFVNHLYDRFHGSVSALVAILDLIRVDLNAIAKIGQKCGMSKKDVSKGFSSVHSKPARARIGDKINYLLRQEDLGDHLKNLQESTKDFETLLQQCAPRPERKHTSMPSPKSKLKVNRYQKVQEAAGSLYHAFGLACTKHRKHQACLKLQADTSTPSQIRFTLILDETSNILRAPLTNISHAASFRLTIESQLNGIIAAAPGGVEPAGLLSTIKACGKRVFEPAECDETKNGCRPTKQKKSVAFASPSQLITMPPSRKTRETELPNFCSDSNFCTHIKHVLDQGLTNDRPLGYLHHRGCSKHLIYLQSRTRTLSLQPTQPFPEHHRKKFSTLKQICQEADSGPPMSKVGLCSLAKQLAIAVLQYHATPWLEQSWNSDHVLVDSTSLRSSTSALGVESNTATRMLCSDSYVDVSIRNPQEGDRTPITDRSRTLIRNWTLFSLGIMLLELAFSRPLRSMQKPQDVDQHNEHNTDYFTAERLQMSVSSIMGTEYAELVRKCIQCDFGYGSDLAVTKLQEGYYEDVVSKLEDLETRFREFGL
ncbi:hypothetical protein PMZ80_008271 [Knufia obscura]|uniref:DUF7580 domain-containing protein n=1 Tax=Knufia obscura TaxID=1635080 RepID=A0ABR0RI63_9EURO|nr:hypothetical protein PMZ80_008271 [Knufia obscura]